MNFKNRADVVAKDSVRGKLLELVKKNPGQLSRVHAEVLERRVPDVHKMLRQMAHQGLVYSSPSSTTSNAHGWHLNSLDMATNKAKIVTQKWDGSLKL